MPQRPLSLKATWHQIAQVLTSEVGSGAYASYLSLARLMQLSDGTFALVTPTAIAKGWVQDNVWSRILELWAAADPSHPDLQLKSRAELPDVDAVKMRRIYELPLTTRTRNALIYSGGFSYVSDLAQSSIYDLIRVPDIGDKSLRDIVGALDELGLKIPSYRFEEEESGEQVTEDELESVPEPLADIPSAYDFGWSERGKLGVSASDANLPVFPHNSSPKDHAQRLEVCEALAGDILGDLSSGKFNVRVDYASSLERYQNRLPKSPEIGNILLADAEARRLRAMFSADQDFLPAAFASHLKIFLEQHIGLRVFYPELEAFYRDVQSGKISEALPLDAVDGLIAGVRAFTPELFEPSVGPALAETESLPVDTSLPAVQSTSSPDVTVPPSDPLGSVDNRKARDFTVAGVVNQLWKAFLSGEKVVKAAHSWNAAFHSLAPHIKPVLDWLRQFIDGI